MKIAAYCRVSTDKDEQLDSLEHQKEFFTEYARKNGHELYRLYADEGITGTSLKKRTEFKRLMEDAKYGLFEIVVVKDISRFARNTVDFLQSIRALKAIGIDTVFLTANMTSLGDSEFILTIFGAMAQEESANLSKRVKWGKKINAKKGRVPQRIYGYDRVDNFTLRINEEEAAVVREIYRLYLDEGLGCRTLTMKLNSMGVTTKFGCDWNPRGVRRILSNPIYCGHYVNNKYEIEDYLTGKQVRTPSDQHFHHERPEWAIISVETFEKAQKMLAERREQYTHGNVTRDGRYSTRHVFSTLIKCEHCGRSFVRRTYTYVNSNSYWHCPTNSQYTATTCQNSTSIKEELLLDAVRGYLNECLSNRAGFIKEIVSEFQKSIHTESHVAVSVEDIQKKIQQLENKKSKYQDMYANDIIDMKELKKKIEPIKASIAELQDSLLVGQVAEKKVENAEDIAKKYIGEIEAFLRLETVSNLDMRKVIDRITIDSSGRAKVYLKSIHSLRDA